MNYVASNLAANRKGHLTIGGVDAVALAEQYGTPLYVMDEDMIRSHCRQFVQSVEEHYDGKGLVCYASKAFCCKAMYRILKEEQMGADVVSAGELYTAMQAQFPPENICYHGNNKTESELALALQYGVGRIVVDQWEEIDLLERIAAQKNREQKILLRITPGIDAHTHDFIRTGQLDSKFGFSLEFDRAMQAVEEVLRKPHLKLDGIHCHIGSQIFDIEPFCHAAEVMLGFMAQVRDKHGITMETLNLGGGFGIRYTGQDDPLPYTCFMQEVAKTVRETVEKLNLSMPYILLEPGRSIVGPAGTTLYTVGNVKEIPGIRTYVSVDGGMTDNIRYALYGAAYDFLLANRAEAEKDTVVTVAGRCCESGDLLGEHISLPKAKPGDILAVCATGAYNYSMASHYNRVPNPAVVMVAGGQAREVVRRETLQDLVKNDLD